MEEFRRQLKELVQEIKLGEQAEILQDLIIGKNRGLESDKLCSTAASRRKGPCPLGHGVRSWSVRDIPASLFSFVFSNSSKENQK
jgi:hypothetical protein